MKETKQKNKSKVEKAKPNNIWEIFAVQKTTWLETYVNKEHGITREDILMKDFSSQERYERWYKILAEKKNNNIWIIKENNKVIAFCAAEKKIKNNKISAIYVLPDYQGKGFGAALFITALKWLGDKKEIFLDVVSYNLKAKRFYGKFDFQEIGETPYSELSKLPSDKTMPELRMLKFPNKD